MRLTSKPLASFPGLSSSFRYLPFEKQGIAEKRGAAEKQGAALNDFQKHKPHKVNSYYGCTYHTGASIHARVGDTFVSFTTAVPPLIPCCTVTLIVQKEVLHGGVQGVTAGKYEFQY